jgi:hypothetical protein
MTSLFQIQTVAETGDVTETMLAAVRLWLATYYPDADYANVTAHIRDGLPDLQIPVTLSDSCAPLPQRS